LQTTDAPPPTGDTKPQFGLWVRGTLLVLAAGWATVFGIAAWLNPYTADGTPLRMETHRQMGLPPCTFKYYTDLPCPSCGMTTSFASLIHGDVWNSLKANAVGTLLALFGLLFVPWSVASAYCKRTLFINSVEQALLWLITSFVGLMLLRWAVVLVLAWM